MHVPAGMPVAPVIFYLHGFASSPESTKVRYFSDRLQEHGIALECPDFNAPSFRTLTITRMLEQLEGRIARAGGAPVTLIGSSLGGTLAILARAITCCRRSGSTSGGAGARCRSFIMPAMPSAISTTRSTRTASATMRSTPSFRSRR